MADNPNANRKVEQRRNEQGQYTGEFFFSEPPPLPDPGEFYGTHPGAKPPPLPPAQDERDAAFMARNTEPPPLPPAEEEEDAGIGEAIGAAQTGAKAGGMLGGPLGAVAGGAAGFLLSQVIGSQRDAPIGSLEGSGGTMRNEAGDTLQAMLALQQRVARVGTPVKDAVTTQAAGSKM